MERTPNRYYASISVQPADLLVTEAEDILPIIVTAASGIKGGFMVTVSRNSRRKIVEYITQEGKAVEKDRIWGIFTCPECQEDLFVVNPDDDSADLELGCVNGHAWTIGIAE